MNCLLILNVFYPEESNFYTTNEYEDVIQNIIKESQYFDYAILINNLKCELSGRSLKIRNLIFEESLKSKNFLYLSKTTLSAFSTEHNKQLVLNYHFDHIQVCGFAGCMDIIPTCLSLIDMKQNVYTLSGSVGDFSPLIKQKSLEYLQLLNILKDA